MNGILKKGLSLGLLIFSSWQLSAQEIKVLTYNIYHGEAHYNRGNSNLEAVAALINRYKPDLVALQEVDSMTQRTAKFNGGQPVDIVSDLAKLTGMHGVFGKAIDYSGGGYGEGLLSKQPIKPTFHALSIPKGGEGRVLVTAPYTLSNGKKIIFGATHLCHEFDENQQQQAKDINTILQKTNLPSIVAGDLNIRDTSNAYQLLEKNFVDVAKDFGKPDLTFPFDNPSIRIDYVFVNKSNKWRVKSVEVLKVDASDHMPLLVTLELM